MNTASRERRALVWAVACATALAVLYAGSQDIFWTGDFYDEAWPAYVKLQREGWEAFRAHLPGYSGFVTAYGGWNWPGEDAFHMQRIHGDPGIARLSNWLTLDPRKLRRGSRISYQKAFDCPGAPGVSTEGCCLEPVSIPCR